MSKTTPQYNLPMQPIHHNAQPIPYYGYHPQMHPQSYPQMHPQSYPLMQPQMQPISNPNLKFAVSRTKSERAIVLKNIIAPYAVDVFSKTLKFQRGTPNKSAEMKFTFKPDGKQHTVNIINEGAKPLSFTLVPKASKVKVSNDSKIIISNLYDTKSLVVKHDKPLSYSLVPCKKLHSYSLKFDAKDQVVDMNIFKKVGDKKIALKGGKIKLAPLNRPVAKLSQRSAPMNIAPPSYAPMGYMQPQLYAAPPSYGVSPMAYHPRQAYHPQQPPMYFAPPQYRN